MSNASQGQFQAFEDVFILEGLRTPTIEDQGA